MNNPDNWIQTYSGRPYRLGRPSPDDVHIIDIAHALSNLCRYTGHCKSFYSVAEHSVLVSQVVPPEYALQGLLHDATEAYVGDVARPLKQMLPQYQEIEALSWVAVADRFGLPHYLHDSVHEADFAVLLAEKDVLMENAPHDWGVRGTRANVTIVGHSPAAARNLFLQRFEELTA